MLAARKVDNGVGRKDASNGREAQHQSEDEELYYLFHLSSLIVAVFWHIFFNLSIISVIYAFKDIHKSEEVSGCNVSQKFDTMPGYGKGVKGFDEGIL